MILWLSGNSTNIRVWRSLVSRLNGVQEAPSSNLGTRTKRPLSVWKAAFFYVRKFWDDTGFFGRYVAVTSYSSPGWRGFFALSEIQVWPGYNVSACCICNQQRHAMIGHDEFILHIRVLKFCLYTIVCTKATKKLPRQEQRSHHRRLSVQEQGSRGGLWPFSIKNR